MDQLSTLHPASNFSDLIIGKFAAKTQRGFTDYWSLYKWSVAEFKSFWEQFLYFAEVRCSKFHTSVMTDVDFEKVPSWFVGCQLNYAENLLRWCDDNPAIYFCCEGRLGVDCITFKQLHQQVAIYAHSLKSIGVAKNDRIVGYLPNCTEAVVACLAAASLGAVWSSASPDFGVQGVLERFGQVEPKVMFSVNAVCYNGKVHDHMKKLEAVAKGLPSLERIVIIPYVRSEAFECQHIKNSCLLDEFVGPSAAVDPSQLTFEQVDFDHPLFIMFSSGTTGAPKCMVHSVGGTLLQHLKEHLLHGNLTRSDIMLYYTTTSWMMWNWLLSVLAVGASIVLYDGSPLVPSPNVLWDLVDQIGVTVIGTGAKWISVLEERHVRPAETHSLKTLHTLLSTGSPLKPESFDYVYNHIKKDLLLGSVSGGTDLISCFMLQNWALPVYRGQIQGPGLGMAIECWDEDGHRIYDSPGELVCVKAFPSMPRCFLNDPQGARYHRTYFEKFSGVWAHGDFCLIDSTTNGIVMLGRSDGTLNPNGVRFGSAEIYNIVEQFKEVQDCLCVAQRNRDASDERVVLFVKLGAGVEFSNALVQRLTSTIRLQLSARHVPAFVLPIADIPYTMNAKKVEVAVSKILSALATLPGDAPPPPQLRAALQPNSGSLANPNSLDQFWLLDSLRHF